MFRSSLLMVLSCLAAQTLAAADLPAGQNVAGSLSAGLSLTRGNSQTDDLNLTFDLAQRVTPRNVAKYDAFYLRAAEDGALTVDRTTLGARDEFTVSPLTFAFADVHYLRDRFKEIDSLITPTVGAGEHLIKNASLDLSAEAGVGVAVEKDRGQPRSTSGALSAKQVLSWKFSSTATLGETVAGLWKLNHIGDALYHVDVSLAGDLTKHSELKLEALDDYKTRPPSPKIKKNDLSLIASIVMKF